MQDGAVLRPTQPAAANQLRENIGEFSFHDCRVSIGVDVSCVSPRVGVNSRAGLAWSGFLQPKDSHVQKTPKIGQLHGTFRGQLTH
jgi:hypothetical protein